ncbi:MAG: anti-sigma factor, partial [Anaerolineae bacterium]
EKLNGYMATAEEPVREQMTCEQVAQYLSDYIDNELDEPLSAIARAHIATCPHCHLLLDTMQDTITLCREGTKRVIPEASRKRIFGEIKLSFAKRARG